MDKKKNKKMHASSPNVGEVPELHIQDEGGGDVQKQADEYLAGWQRALADYENLKREMARDREALSKYAAEDLMRDLLPALDYFESALEHKPNAAKCDEVARKGIDNWVAGVQHVHKLLFDRLADRGLTRIAGDGVYDPHVHEVAEEQESDKPVGTILKVVQHGYRLHDKLLRPARVIVAKPKADSVHTTNTTNT